MKKIYAAPALFMSGAVVPDTNSNQSGSAESLTKDFSVGSVGFAL